MKTRAIKNNDPTTSLNYVVKYYCAELQMWRSHDFYLFRRSAIKAAKKLAKKKMGKPEIIWESEL